MSKKNTKNINTDIEVSNEIINTELKPVQEIENISSEEEQNEDKNLIEDMQEQEQENDFVLGDENEKYHENVYELVYIDDIAKNKRKKQKEIVVKEKQKENNKKINKVLNVFLGIGIACAICAIIFVMFPDKIAYKYAQIDAYITNKKIERQVKNGELQPASSYEADTEFKGLGNGIIDLQDSEKQEQPADNNEGFTVYYKRNDMITNFNEAINLNLPEESDIQSQNDEKIIMVKSNTMHQGLIKFNNYGVTSQGNKYQLIVNTSFTNVNHPQRYKFNGNLTTSIEDEEIKSETFNFGVESDTTEDIQIAFSLTERQYKLIKKELDNLTFTYNDDYNTFRTFATYGGNFENMEK